MKNKEKITNYMTETSAVHWDYLIQENLTAKEAVNFLKSDMKLRTFADNLTEFYHQEDLEKRLIAGFVNDTGGRKTVSGVRSRTGCKIKICHPAGMSCFTFALSLGWMRRNRIFC